MTPGVGELWTWDSFVVLGASDVHAPFLVLKKSIGSSILLMGSNGRISWYDYPSIMNLIHPLAISNLDLETL